MGMTMEQLIQYMVEHRASDLHIRAKGPCYIRADGDVSQIPGSELTQDEIKKMAFDRMPPNAKRDVEKNMHCDFSFGIEGLGRFRTNFYSMMGQFSMTIRWVAARVPTFEDLKLPVEAFKKLCENERGIILVTGITGSGKSSTLASMINYINENKSSHIITIEDPVEYVHQNKQSIITQRELGLDTPDFVQAIRGALRQDPDTILMGEMRDTETTGAAMTAANTGHLVFGTLHTLDAKTTINRVIDMFPPHQQAQVRQMLAETLKGVISQRLIRGIKGGRVPATEILVVTAHVKKLIEDNHLNDLPDAMKKGGFYGMQTFNQCLVRLCKEGLAAEEEVLAAATNPDDVKLALRGIESEAKV